MSHGRTFTETEAAPPGDGGDGDAWAWATEHGAPEWASTEQLVNWLARGELPPHTLVWKPGWGEWLPAIQVAEFASAFPRVTPGSRRVSRVAFDGALTPPPVPVAHYPRLRLLAKDVMSESPLPPSTAILQGLAPARAGRRALRDLDHLQQDLVTSQVPAAAMLEAALAMKRLGTPVTPSKTERWDQLDLGTFGEAPPPVSTPAPRTLSPHALELAFPAPREPEPAEKRSRPSKQYGRWLLLGALVGGALGLLSIRVSLPQAAEPPAMDPPAIGALRPAAAPAPERAPPAPPRAVESAPRALSVDELERVAPPAVKKPPGIYERRRPGEPAVLQALRISKNEGFDRVVFEFGERVPGYRLEYIDKPVRDCGTGDARRIDGDSRLEVRFSPAYAHTKSGEPTVRAREFKPALSMIREIERTCDFEGVVTWVVGTASPHRFRAFELATPPRLVVDIDH
jgi:GYF domain 2